MVYHPLFRGILVSGVHVLTDMHRVVFVNYLDMLIQSVIILSVQRHKYDVR